MYDERPRLELSWRPPDKALEILALAALLGFAGVAAAYLADLPGRVPSHFGLGGEPDAWAGRGSLWALPAVAVFLYGLLTWAARVPHLYNYPWAITEANAERQYRLARRLILAMKALVCWQLLGLYLQTLQVAAGERTRLSLGLMLSLLLGFLAVTVIYLVVAARRP